MFIVRLSLQLAGLCDNDALLCQTHELCSQFRSRRTDSEVALAPVWHRPGFLMDVFGLGVNQITGMCPALCYALRLALLSHDVSLRFQSIISCWYVL